MAETKPGEKKGAEQPAERWTQYTVPLKKAFAKSRVHRAPAALRTIRAFLEKHTRAGQKNIKLSPELNKSIWERGRENIPRKIKIKTITANAMVNAFLADEKVTEKKPVEKKEKRKPETSAEDPEKKVKQEEKKAKERAIEKAAIKRGST